VHALNECRTGLRLFGPLTGVIGRAMMQYFYLKWDALGALAPVLEGNTTDEGLKTRSTNRRDTSWSRNVMKFASLREESVARLANEVSYDDVPAWLGDETSSSWQSFAFGIGFVVLTLLIAYGGERLIKGLPHQYTVTFGQSTLQLRADISPFFAWDMAAILSMLSYFIYYWIRIFSKDGPMRAGGRDVALFGGAIAFLVLGLIFLVFSFLAGLAFAVAMPGAMGGQLLLLTAAAFLILWADYSVVRKHTDKKIQLEFKLFVEFVDWPMAICFTVLSLFYLIFSDQQNLQQFSSFISGAIAFQIIAFNVAFAFLDRFTKVISRGKTAVLLRDNGDFALDYREFKASWWKYWQPGSAPAPKGG
jgi:hypothetical protein